MKICKSVAELVGNTPLLELVRIEKKLQLSARILAKLEYFNPAGSIKDRVALEMIRNAEKTGALKPGGTIIEPTSGNTGIGLAAIAAAYGYDMIVVMPDSMSRERRQLVLAYGAKLVLTKGSQGMKGAISKAEELARSIPGSFVAGQFANPANPKAHKKTTGPEIYNAANGKIDFFIAGAGTGGTITGAGEYLKEKIPHIKIVAAEPENSAVLSGNNPGSHKIQGIGAGFIPDVLNRDIIDEIIKVPDEEAFKAARLAGISEGILIGISSGAALWSAVQIAKRPENAGKICAAIFPDGGERYFSAGLYLETEQDDLC